MILHDDLQKLRSDQHPEQLGDQLLRDRQGEIRVGRPQLNQGLIAGRAVVNRRLLGMNSQAVRLGKASRSAKYRFVLAILKQQIIFEKMLAKYHY